MRILLALAPISLLFVSVSSSLGAGSTPPPGSGTPPVSDIKPIKGDEYADAVLQLYDLARCGCMCCCAHPAPHPPTPCVGSRLICRLNAIDGIGSYVKSHTAVLCLSQLLKEQCCLCGSSPCGGDVESVLIGLHAIEALKNIGANAKPALPAITCACCISPELSVAISDARAKILAPPKQQPAPTPAPSDAVKQATDKVNAAFTALKAVFSPPPNPSDIAGKFDDLGKAIAALEAAKAAATK